MILGAADSFYTLIVTYPSVTNSLAGTAIIVLPQAVIQARRSDQWFTSMLEAQVAEPKPPGGTTSSGRFRLLGVTARRGLGGHDYGWLDFLGAIRAYQSRESAPRV